MSTRGFVGTYLEGVTRGYYNHFDSMPDRLGKNLADELNTPEINLSKYKILVRHWRAVSPVGSPTNDLLRSMLKFDEEVKVDLGAPDNDALFEPLCGGILRPLALGWYPDHSNFLYSPGCEWGYIWNLDQDTLEVYESLDDEHAKLYPPGRYRSTEAVTLVAVLPRIGCSHYMNAFAAMYDPFTEERPMELYRPGEKLDLELEVPREERELLRVMRNLTDLLESRRSGGFWSTVDENKFLEEARDLSSKYDARGY